MVAKGAQVSRHMLPRGPAAPRPTTQELIMNLLAVQHLLKNGTVTLDTETILHLTQYTVRVELVDPKDPEHSPIMCTAITVEQAKRFMEELKKSQGDA